MATLEVGTSQGDLFPIPIEPDVYDWGINDISASDSGRVQDSACTMYKNRVARKRKLSLGWVNPSLEDASAVLKMFAPEYVYVRYLDVEEGKFMTKLFYTGDKTAPFRTIRLPNGSTVSKLAFDIIER